MRAGHVPVFADVEPDTPVGGRSFFEDLDGIDYDNMFIFDELAWNFEPSELGAAFGLVQLDKLDTNYKRRIRTFDMYTEALGRYPEVFTPPGRSMASIPRGSRTRSSSTRTPASVGPTCSRIWRSGRSIPGPFGPATPSVSPSCRVSPSASPRLAFPTPTW